MAAEYLVYPLDGTDTQNTRKVINMMRDIVAASLTGKHRAKTLAVAKACFANEDINTLSEKKAARIAAAFVRRNIRYQSDPEDTEYIMFPHVIYREGYGDCDDMTVLFCALMLAAGFPTKIEAIKYRGDKYYSHVYARVNGAIFDCTLPATERPRILSGDRLMSVSV